MESVHNWKHVRLPGIFLFWASVCPPQSNCFYHCFYPYVTHVRLYTRFSSFFCTAGPPLRFCKCSKIFIIQFGYMISVLSSDSGSSVSGHSEVQFSREEMAEAIKIKEEIQQTGMYFAWLILCSKATMPTGCVLMLTCFCTFCVLLSFNHAHKDKDN